LICSVVLSSVSLMPRLYRITPYPQTAIQFMRTISCVPEHAAWAVDLAPA